MCLVSSVLVFIYFVRYIFCLGVPCRNRMIGYRVFISKFSDSTSKDDIVYQHKGNGIPAEVVRIPATGRSGR